MVAGRDPDAFALEAVERDREDNSLAAPESTYLRTVISRFGGMMKEGTAVAIPPQTWNYVASAPTTSYRSRFGSTHSVVGAGVPGYMGYVPHGTTANAFAQRNMRTSAAVSRPAHRAHATVYSALNRSLMPKRMPIVGYRGHLRGTKESTVSFGTSHWRPNAPTNRAAAAAMAYEAARAKRLDFPTEDPLSA